MDMNQFQAGNWLNAAALGPHPRQLVIQAVTPQVVDEGNPPKPVVMFMGEPRGLPLNKTNLTKLITAFGSESDAWVGKTIEVYTEPVNFQGQMVQGVRMRLPAPVQQPVQQPAVQQPAVQQPAQPAVDVTADVPASVTDYRA